MNIRSLTDKIKTVLNENVEFNEFDRLCDFINDYINHFATLKLIFGTNIKSDEGIIYLDNIEITDGLSYWVVDGNVIDKYTSGHGIDFSASGIKDTKKGEYIFLLDVCYKYTSIYNVIRKSDIDNTSRNKIKIAEWLFTAANTLLQQDARHMDEYIN